MPDQKQDPRDVDLNGWPRTIEGWLAPHYPPQPKITVIKTAADAIDAKIETLARDR
jgi:hypothetical protein